LELDARAYTLGGATITPIGFIFFPTFLRFFLFVIYPPPDGRRREEFGAPPFPPICFTGLLIRINRRKDPLHDSESLSLLKTSSGPTARNWLPFCYLPWAFFFLFPFLKTCCLTPLKFADRALPPFAQFISRHLFNVPSAFRRALPSLIFPAYSVCSTLCLFSYPAL